MFGFNRAKKAAAVAAVTAAAAATALLTAPAAVAAPQPIVGGTTTTTTAYPFVMQITDASQSQFCGGTLVSPTKVVTAAHCMVGETTSSVRVVGGRTYLNGTNGTVSRVSKIWIHPSYTDATNGDDVAVLTLSTSMPYTTAKYVSSSQTSVYAAGATARILGCGTTSAGGSSSNQLRTATVPTVSDSSCARLLRLRLRAERHGVRRKDLRRRGHLPGRQRRPPAHRGRPGRHHFLGRRLRPGRLPGCLHPADHLLQPGHDAGQLVTRTSS
ncbi:hypothetical protein SPURM210S_05024 [Streptomyces purpurascens]